MILGGNGLKQGFARSALWARHDATKVGRAADCRNRQGINRFYE
jgi:hypothetical protein